MELLLKTFDKFKDKGEKPFRSTKSVLEAVTFTWREIVLMRCDT